MCEALIGEARTDRYAYKLQLGQWKITIPAFSLSKLYIVFL